MEEFKNLKEIIELSEEEINNNDYNVSAVLDLEDLKELRNLIERYKETKQELESVKEIYYTQKEIETNYIKKSKVKEKIEEIINTGIDVAWEQINYSIVEQDKAKIQVLQELIED